ncbi:MAG: hypothetical protein COB12_12930, partial [Flavobacterium sp.]
MKKITLILLMFVFTCFTYGQTITKTYTPPSSVTVDGCGTYCVTLPSVSFTAVDFPSGGIITDVNVSISWLKTDGSCGAPGTGNSFHNETSFRVNGPVSQSILATPGTWSGGANSPAVTTVFDQASASIPSGTPVSGTFLPNGGNLNVFNNSCGIGTWSLSAGDTANLDPLCVISYSITITVVPDTIAPVAICQSVTAQLDAAGNVTVNASDFDNGSTDNCGITNMTINGFSSITYTCADIALSPINIQFEVFDAAGNSDVCFTNVTIEDNTPPTGTLLTPTVQLDNTGNVTITPADVVNNISDNCDPNPTVSINPTSFDCSQLGAQTVSVTITDVSGNVFNQNTQVLVEDTTPPNAVCIPPVGPITFLSEDFSDNSAGWTLDTEWEIGAATTSSCPTFNQDPSTDNSPSGDNGVAGVNIGGCASTPLHPYYFLTSPVIDVSSSTGTLSLDFYRWLNSDYTPYMKNIIQVWDGATWQTIWETYGSSTEDTSWVNQNFDITAYQNAALQVRFGFNIANGGVFTVSSWNLDDIVISSTSGGGLTVSLDSSGQVTINVSDIDGGSSDNCGIDTMSISPSTFTCADVGLNDVTLTVTDINGNVSSCTTQIIVVDDIDPTWVNAPADMTVQCDGSGNTTDFTNWLTSFTGTDNCPNPIVTNNSTGLSDDCGATGTETVTFTLTDASGNAITQDAIFTIEDTTDPVWATPPADMTVECDGTADPSGAFAAWLVSFSGTDTCGTAAVTNNSTGLSDLCGATGTETVTFTLTDECGNAITQDAIFTIEDTTDPVWDGLGPEDMTVECDGTADPSGAFAAWLVSFSGTDTCGTATVTNNSTGLSDLCGATGTETVTFTLTDECGNAITQDAIFTIEDTTDPTIVCPMDIDISTDPGVCGAEVDFPMAVALDSCGSVTVAQTGGLPTNSFFPVGVSTVEFTATDECGNTSVCSFTITITDDEPAIAVCQDITIQLDEFGNVSIVAADIDGGSTDNCGIASISASQTDFDCSDVGDNNITLTVTDVNGNTSTCIAVVTVEDVTLPVAVCQDITVALDANGTVTITGMDVGGASTDACGIVSYDLDIDTFDCSNIGDNLVTLTVTDPSGNTATCTATVTIEDITPPVLVCADVTLELGPDGTLAINPEDLLAYSPTTYNVITISSDNGSNTEGFTDLTVTVTDAAAISFDWDYTTTDGPAFDSFGILLNGVYTEISDPLGANTQSGNYGLNVVPGDVFGFRSYSLDGGFGA